MAERGPLVKVLQSQLEVAAICCNFEQKIVRGVRILQRARGGWKILKYAQSENPSWTKAVDAVVKELNLHKSVYRVLCIVPEDCDVFECQLPTAAPGVLREALRFEIPRQFLSVPEKFQLQYTLLKNNTAQGLCRVRCAVYPDEVIHKLTGQLAMLKNKFDVVMHPLLALPEEAMGHLPVYLPEVSDEFGFTNGEFMTLPAEDKSAGNQQLDGYLRKYFAAGFPDGEWLSGYRTALTCAVFAVRKLFVSKSQLAAVNILPVFLKPARFRNQLRMMILLILLLAAVNIFRYAGGFWQDYREYRQLAAKVNNTRNRVQELRKKVKSGEKSLKEFQRTADLSLGSRKCLGYLGYISEKLPPEVLLSNFRYNEGSLELNFQTASQDLDMVAFFNRLPGFKVLNAAQRNNPHGGITIGNVRLAPIDEEK